MFYLLLFLLTEILFCFGGGRRVVKEKLKDRCCSWMAVGTKNLIVITAECVINHLILICS